MKSILLALATSFGGGAVAQDAGCDPQRGPMLTRGAEMYEVGLVLPPETVADGLPPGLRPVAGHTGGIAVYCLHDGLTPRALTLVYLWIDVQGYDSPDGSSARFVRRGYGSDLPPGSETVLAPGTVRRSFDGDLIRLVAGPGNGGGPETVRLVLRLRATNCRTEEAISHYILPESHDRLVLVGMPGIFDWCDADVVLADFDPAADPALIGLAYTAVLWAGAIRNAAFMAGYARPLVQG